MANYLTPLFSQSDHKRQVALIGWQVANVSKLPEPDKYEVTVVASILNNLTQEILPGRMAFLEVTQQQLEDLLIAPNIVTQVNQQSPVYFNAPKPMPRLRPVVGKVKWYPQDQIAAVIVKRMGDMTEQLRPDAPGTLAASLFDPPITGVTRVFVNIQDIAGMEGRRNPVRDDYFTITAPKLQKIILSPSEKQYLEEFTKVHPESKSILLESQPMSFPLSEASDYQRKQIIRELFFHKKHLPVTHDSRIEYKRIVEQIGRYFLRETKQDFLPYSLEPDGYDPEIIAFLFLSPVTKNVIGACHFSWVELKYPNPSIWILEWLWIHPYSRGRGVMNTLWDLFKTRFGKFHARPPFSKAMSKFLKTHHYESPIISSPAFDKNNDSVRINPTRAPLSDEIRQKIISLCSNTSLSLSDISVKIQEEFGIKPAISTISIICKKIGISRELHLSEKVRTKIISLCSDTSLSLRNISVKIQEEFGIKLAISTISRICKKTKISRGSPLAGRRVSEEVRTKLISLCGDLSLSRTQIINQIQEEFGITIGLTTISRICRKAGFSRFENSTFAEWALAQNNKWSTQLLQEWNIKKNLPLTSSDINISNIDIKLIWSCSQNVSHPDWPADINHRTRGAGCPKCARLEAAKKTRIPVPGQSFGDLYPELVIPPGQPGIGIWDAERNLPVSPFSIHPYTDGSYWWICPKHSSHRWQATVASRIDGRGCPCCSHPPKKVCEDNSLAALYPQTLKYWDYEHNTISPDKILPFTRIRVFWKCLRGHISQAGLPMKMWTFLKTGKMPCEDCSREQRSTKRLKKFDPTGRKGSSSKSTRRSRRGGSSFDIGPKRPNPNFQINPRGIHLSDEVRQRVISMCGDLSLTQTQIADRIQKEFGIHTTQHTISKICQKVGLSRNKKHAARAHSAIPEYIKKRIADLSLDLNLSFLDIKQKLQEEFGITFSIDTIRKYTKIRKLHFQHPEKIKSRIIELCNEKSQTVTAIISKIEEEFQLTITPELEKLIKRFHKKAEIQLDHEISRKIKKKIIKYCRNFSITLEEISIKIQEEFGIKPDISTISKICKKAGFSRGPTLAKTPWNPLSEEVKNKIIKYCKDLSITQSNIIAKIQEEFGITTTQATISNICRKAGIRRHIGFKHLNVKIKQKIIGYCANFSITYKDISIKIQEEFGITIDPSTISSICRKSEFPRLRKKSVISTVIEYCKDPSITYKNIVAKIQEEFGIIITQSTISNICKEAGILNRNPMEPQHSECLQCFMTFPFSQLYCAKTGNSPNDCSCIECPSYCEECFEIEEA